MENSFGALSSVLMLFLAGLALLFFVFWLWMLIHAITNKGLRDMEKLLWVLVIVFVGFIGPILYFFIGRPKAIRQI